MEDQYQKAGKAELPPRPLDNKIKTSDDQTPRFWIDGEGGDFEKQYMSGPSLLQFLQDNDPIICGCDFMSDKEYAENVVEEG